MRVLFYSILFALINNVDNIGVRIAYSIKGIKMTIGKNLLISAITFFISGFSTYCGSALSGLINPKICSVFSMLLLSGIGIWFIADFYIKNMSKKKRPDKDSDKTVINIITDPEDPDIDNSKDIDFKEAAFLGISLSLNNIGGSLSAGMIGLSGLLIGFLSAAISFLTLLAGNYLTDLFIKINLSKKAVIVSGLIMIAIGIKQLF